MAVRLFNQYYWGHSCQDGWLDQANKMVDRLNGWGGRMIICMDIYRMIGGWMDNQLTGQMFGWMDGGVSEQYVGECDSVNIEIGVLQMDGQIRGCLVGKINGYINRLRSGWMCGGADGCWDAC